MAKTTEELDTMADKHGLGWQDGKLASLRSCGDVDVRDYDVILSAGRLKKCPHCEKALRLIWDVYVVEVDGEDSD